jgi:hypothetical protein
VAADFIVLLHFLFVLFVVFGGALVLWRPWIAWLHLPAVVWGVLVEYAGWICPLTPLENHLRRQQGEVGYEGDFLARHVLPLLYPDGLTRRHQVILGTFALAINICVYAIILGRRRSTSTKDL